MTSTKYDVYHREFNCLPKVIIYTNYSIINITSISPIAALIWSILAYTSSMHTVLFAYFGVVTMSVEVITMSIGIITTHRYFGM